MQPIRIVESARVDPSVDSFLKVRDAGRRIDGHWIWRGVSFELERGKRLGVTGPSGSGKTLLFRTLAGLDRLDEGAIRYRDARIGEWSLPDYRSRVVYLMQTPALLEGSVEDNLRAIFDFDVHAGRAFDRAWALHRLEGMGRDAVFLERSAAALSGGERQIVAFLRAVQLEPEVLLLDEPTANLDAESTRQIEQLVAAWLEEDSVRAALWTSHQADQLARMTDRLIDLTDYHDDAR